MVNFPRRYGELPFYLENPCYNDVEFCGIPRSFPGKHREIGCVTMTNKKLALLLSGLMLLSACGAPQQSSAGQSAPTAAEAASSAEKESAAVNAVSAQITLSDDGVKLSGSGVKADDAAVTITKSGSYEITGTLSDGQIIVDADKNADITLILSGASISCSTSAPIYVKEAASVNIYAASGTENYVSDSDGYVLEEGEDEPDAAIFSKADLSFSGDGKLTVEGNYDMAIHSKDSLFFYDSGTYEVLSAGDGIKGKDSVLISGAAITLSITAGEDGIQSSNSTDASLGTVTIEYGTVSITAGKHGIKSETALSILGGNLTIDAQEDGLHAGTSVTLGREDSSTAPTLDITAQCDGIQSGTDFALLSGSISAVTGGGAANAPEHVEEFGFPGWFDTQEDSSEETSSSAKGLKSGGDMTISGDSVTLDCMDDGLHCTGKLTISDEAKLTIASGDDGIHSDDTLDISGGTIDITQSYEGLEAVFITISGGDITLAASDDGLNAAGGSSADTDFEFMGPPGGEGTAETLEDASYYILITGGTLNVDAGGDGLDSNGAFFMQGGTVIVSGPEDSMNGALDYTTTGQITGGTLIACGASGMAQNLDSSSTQCSLLYNLGETVQGGTTVALTDASGTVLFEAEMAKSFSSIVISTPDMQVGETYTLTCGDMSVDAELTDTITALGSGGFGGFGGGFGGGPGGPPPVF